MLLKSDGKKWGKEMRGISDGNLLEDGEITMDGLK